MEKYTAKNIRNIAVVGHQGCGKTSLVESLLEISGQIIVKGSVEKGTTVSDYLPYELEKGGSFNTTVCPVYHKDYKLNLIDLPGSDEFISEVENVLSICKGAILVIDASSGIQVGTKNCFRLLQKLHIPSIIYVNKMDKENIQFDQILEEIRFELGSNVVLFTWPTGHEERFDGFVNVVDLKARKYTGKECIDAEIYPDKKMRVLELHNTILEAVAQTSESLLEKFFEGEDLTREEIHIGLRTAVLDGEIMPILVGSATKNIGVHTMIDMLCDYLPNPADLKPLVAKTRENKEITILTSEEEPFSGYIFKTVVDPFLGVINYFKVNSGVIRPGDEIVVGLEGIEKVKDVYVTCGKKQVAVEALYAGDIGTITKIPNLLTGMSISSPKRVVVFDGYQPPKPTQYIGIKAKTKNDEDKLSSILQKVLVEEPCAEIMRNVETAQMLLGGQGMQHLEYILDKIRRTYKVELETEKQKIVYRETIKAKAEAQGRYVKQSGGSGFYGVVQMSFEPTTVDSYFTEEIFGGSVPKNYFPAVEKGFFEALEKGGLAGYPVINVYAKLLDGKYHAVDSNELAFRMAAILAFKEAYQACKPVLLEPIMRVKITVDEKYLGDIMSDINQRRGKVISMDPVGNGTQIIVANIPEAEIIEYKMDLSSLTQGNGIFEREMIGYEEVPAYIAEKVIQEVNNSK